MSSADEPRLAGRDGVIWRDYCRGATQQKLARKYGVSQQRISQIVAEVRDSIPIEERDAIVKREVDFLASLREELMELWDAEAPSAYAANGRELEGVKDHSGRLAALAAAEKLTGRLHRVLGIDAPTKVDLSVAGEEEATRRDAAEALSRLHGGTESE